MSLSLSSFVRRFGPGLVVTMLACSSSSSPGGGTTPVTSSGPANLTWCTNPAPAGCNRVPICGVCVATPTDPLARTTDSREYSGKGAPDLSCLQKGAALKPLDTAGSKKISVKGYARIFANGPDSKNVKVELFREILAPGPTGQLGDKVGETTTVDKLADGTGTKKETIVKSGVSEDRTLYPFQIDGVPTETPLIAKTSSKTSVATDGWFQLFDYNQVILNGAPTCATPDATACFASDGSYHLDVRALGNDDYASILKAAYSRPPEGGKSAIAGEVHDCGDVRLSNATVGIGPTAGLGLFYLSEVEDNPLPEIGRKATGRLGLYAAGGLDPGTYTLAASGKSGSDVYALGSYTVQTFPDSVSVFTFRGLRPWQVTATK